MRLKRTCLLTLSLLFLFACGLVDRPLPATRGPDPDTGEPATGISYELFDESPAPEVFTFVRVGRSSATLQDILRAEAQKAAGMGRYPYVEFYADWCPPCTALRESIADARMVDAFAGTYIIRLDLDQWEQKLSGTGFYIIGIPAFYELDQDGVPTGRMITGGAWGEDIPENIAPPMKEFFNNRATE